MPDKTALEAIDSAIASLNPAETPAPEVEAPEVEAVDPPEGETAEVEAVDLPEGEETPDGDAPEAPEAGEEPEVETPDAAAVKPAADKGKKPDHVNDPIEPTLHARTQDRIKFLAEEVKALTPLREVEARHNELMDTIASTGMNANEFNATLNYGRLIHGTLDEKREAWNFLLNEMKGLAGAIGEPLPGTDPVSAHPDLQAEVAAGTLTGPRATEIATQRMRALAQANATTQASRVQQSTAQTKQETDAATSGLNALGKELAGSDPDYQRKYAILVPTLRESFKEIAPRHWVATMRRAFSALKLPAAAPAAPRRTPPANQPTRANKQPTGGSTAVPKTMAEAMEAGIKQATR